MNFLLNITKIIIFLSPISFIISPLFVNVIVVTLSVVTLVLVFFRKSYNLFFKKNVFFLFYFAFLDLFFIFMKTLKVQLEVYYI